MSKHGHLALLVLTVVVFFLPSIVSPVAGIAGSSVEVWLDWEELAVGQLDVATVHGCTKNLFIITNEEGTPLPDPIVKVAQQVEFTPIAEGLIKLKAECLSPQVVIVRVHIPVDTWVLRTPERSQVGDNTEVRVDGCEDGMLVISNGSGSPLPSPIVRNITGNPYTTMVTAVDVGQVKVKGLCWQPANDDSTRYNYIPIDYADANKTTLEVRWYPPWEVGDEWYKPEWTYVLAGTDRFPLEFNEWHHPFLGIGSIYGIYTAQVPKDRSLKLVFSDYHFDDNLEVPMWLSQDYTYIYKVWSDGDYCPGCMHLRWFWEFAGYGDPSFLIVPGSYQVYLPFVAR